MTDFKRIRDLKDASSLEGELEEGQHCFDESLKRQPIGPDTGFLSQEAPPLAFGIAVGFILVMLFIAGIVMAQIGVGSGAFVR